MTKGKKKSIIGSNLAGTPLGHYLSVTTCSAGVAADKSVFYF
nr:MAG TPA: hypothetical protein [Caudoviricetes sp.]